MKNIYAFIIFSSIFTLPCNPITERGKPLYIHEESADYDDTQANIMIEKSVLKYMLKAAKVNANSNQKPLQEFLKKRLDLKVQKLHAHRENKKYNDEGHSIALITQKDLYHRILPYIEAYESTPVSDGVIHALNIGPDCGLNRGYLKIHWDQNGAITGSSRIENVNLLWVHFTQNGTNIKFIHK